MKSPFPGMDPYIEACGLWEDFHHDLIAAIKAALMRVVPRGYHVLTGERAYIVLAEGEGKKEHHFQADVGVTSTASRKKSRKKKATVATDEAVEAVSLRAFIATEYRETFVEVYAAKPERHLVTSIEVLSPSNKRKNSRGWKKYLRKRQALLLGDANLVEIDLLRGGSRMPMHDPWPESPYVLLVARDEHTPYCKVWPAHFQRPLPILPVPLSSPDPDVPLDLQAIIEAIYDASRYDEQIDYSSDLTPELPDADVAWVKEQVKGRTRKQRQ